MKKWLCLLLCLALLPLPAWAAGPAVAAPSAVLMGPDGAVLFEKNADEKREPASVTKVMTLLLVFEALDRGELKLTDRVTASAHACSMGGTQVWLKEGEQLTAEEMIKCVVLPSANDCAVALAEHLAGSEGAFVERMNARAQELGMTNTHFVNACGLHAEGHVTSARDVARMSLALMKHKQIVGYTTLWQDSIRGGAFVLTNTNKLVRTYPGLTGLKTGFTSQAGYCVAATAERDGLALAAVIMQSDSVRARNADAAALLDWGFANYAAVTPCADRPLGPVRVRLGRRAAIACELAGAETLTVRRAALGSLEKTLELPDEVAAPVRKGDRLGTLTVSLDGAALAELPVTAAEDSARLTVGELFLQMARRLCLRKN